MAKVKVCFSFEREEGVFSACASKQPKPGTVNMVVAVVAPPREVWLTHVDGTYSWRRRSEAEEMTALYPTGK